MRRGKRMMEELDADIREHIEREMQNNIERGMTAQDARYAAVRKFGNVLRLKEEVRDVWYSRWLEQLGQVLRYGLRMLRKSPGFTVVAVFTLALGIGANTAIFSIVDTVLLRPLPFKDPSRLISVHEGIPKMGYPKMGFSHPDFAVFAREQKSFDALGSFRSKHVAITDRGEPERISVSRVSASLFYG